MNDREVFECIGYMNAKEDNNDFSMFVNENSYGGTGGFQWQFLDFCPNNVQDHRRIFIHLMSYEEMKRKIIHEYETQRFGYV